MEENGITDIFFVASLLFQLFSTPSATEQTATNCHIQFCHNFPFRCGMSARLMIRIPVSKAYTNDPASRELPNRLMYPGFCLAMVNMIQRVNMGLVPMSCEFIAKEAVRKNFRNRLCFSLSHRNSSSYRAQSRRSVMSAK